MSAALPGASRAGAAPGSARPHAKLAALVLCALVVATFGVVVHHGFVIWDDNQHITENPFVLHPSWENVRRFWSKPFLGLYVPLSYTLFSAEAWVSHATMNPGALDPRVFHGVLLGLHACAALVVFHLVRRVAASPWAAFAGAAVFALHPLQVESVAWVSETRGVLGALLALLALDFYVASAERSTPGTRDGGGIDFRAAALMVLATVCFAGSLLAKPSSVTLPLIALCFERWIVNRDAVRNSGKPIASDRRDLPSAVLLASPGTGRTFKKSVWMLAPWFVLAAIATWINKSEQSDEVLHFVPPLAARPFIATDALAFYLGKLVWPARLAADYGRSAAQVIEHRGLYYSWVALAACVGALFLVEDRRVLVAAACIFVAALLPVLGLVPFAYQDISTVADRYVYLAMLAPALAIAWAFDQARTPAHARTWKAVAAVIVASLAIASHVHAYTWESTRTLFEHTLAIQPKSVIAHHNLGLAAALAGDADEAIVHYEAALAIDPDHATSRNNLGLVYLLRGELERAATEFRDALRVEPRYARPRVNLATALFRMGRVAEAEAELRTVLESSPDDSSAHNSLANVLAAQHRTAEAIAEYETSLALRSDDADTHRNLALVLSDTREWEAAVRHLRTALALRPRWPLAERDLAAALVAGARTTPAVAREAVELAERALAAVGGADVRALDVLASCYAAAARTDDAVRTCDRAIAIAKEKSPERVADLEQKKRAYQAVRDSRTPH